MVLAALERHGLAGETLVVCTTDHGPPFPDMKCTLRDDGTGVFLIVAGPGVAKGVVSSAMVTHLDVYPTLLEAAGVEIPSNCEGSSLRPVLEGTAQGIRDRFYGEINFHVAYEPVRSVRTKHWKYIRRFDESHLAAVFPNCDEGLSRRLVVGRGWLENPRPVEELYDLLADPAEQKNLALDSGHEQILTELREDLLRWMERTGDPLLRGPVEPVRPWRHPPASDRTYSAKH